MTVKPWGWAAVGGGVIGIIIALLVGIQAFHTESANETRKKLDRVVIGHTDGQFITLFSVFLGEKLGVFEKHGLHIVPETMESRIAVPALLSGSIDFSTISREVTTASLKGGDTRFVMLLINNQMQYLVGRADVELNDIRTIAITNQYSTPHYLALTAMERGGFSAELEFLGNIPAARAAVTRGDADAGVFGYFAPVDFEAAGLKLLDDFGDDSLLVGLSTTDTKIRENGDQVARVVQAFQEIIEYVKSHPDDIKSLLYEYYEYSEEVATEKRKVEAAYDGLNRFLSSTGIPTPEEQTRFIQTAKAGEYETLEDVRQINVTNEDRARVFDFRFVK